MFDFSIFALVISQLTFVNYVEEFNPYTMQPMHDGEGVVIDYRKNILMLI